MIVCVSIRLHAAQIMSPWQLLMRVSEIEVGTVDDKFELQGNMAHWADEERNGSAEG